MIETLDGLAALAGSLSAPVAAWAAVRARLDRRRSATLVFARTHCGVSWTIVLSTGTEAGARRDHTG